MMLFVYDLHDNDGYIVPYIYIYIYIHAYFTGLVSGNLYRNTLYLKKNDGFRFPKLPVKQSIEYLHDYGCW